MIRQSVKLCDSLGHPGAKPRAPSMALDASSVILPQWILFQWGIVWNHPALESVGDQTHFNDIELIRDDGKMNYTPLWRCIVVKDWNFTVSDRWAPCSDHGSTNQYSSMSHRYLLDRDSLRNEPRDQLFQWVIDLLDRDSLRTEPRDQLDFPFGYLKILSWSSVNLVASVTCLMWHSRGSYLSAGSICNRCNSYRHQRLRTSETRVAHTNSLDIPGFTRI